ncbi:hypothetical protein EGR_04695 [Echinococcus granulosus]|uniref:Uncharacterized protein n=1 Tax=Echinococcus granulosus TaxID=6210 RepID=W6UHG0_ECHGR|nr:hypothetical protein EGR_04695 [Echinococcus granulosus]EUB60501.1 hypothetical protein EGR_04695 [Echinococcus granulosus]
MKDKRFDLIIDGHRSSICVAVFYRSAKPVSLSTNDGVPFCEYKLTWLFSKMRNQEGSLLTAKATLSRAVSLMESFTQSCLWYLHEDVNYVNTRYRHHFSTGRAERRQIWLNGFEADERQKIDLYSNINEPSCGT